MYQYKNLEECSFYEISECLNCAFSDYALPIHLSEPELSALFSASGIDRRLSFGAFFRGALVGFLLNSCGLYQGHRTAFDVATGVIPAHRGKQVFTNLFALAQQTLRQGRIERYCLEVLQQNERAIALYKRLGFFISREFFVLSGSALKSSRQPESVQYASLAAFDFQQAADINRNRPSYEHSDHILALHPDLYNVAYIKDRPLTAWCVFSNATGQIFQFGWSSIQDLREVVQSLLGRYPHVTVKNIESSQQQILKMLESLQLKNYIARLCAGSTIIRMYRFLGGLGSGSGLRRIRIRGLFEGPGGIYLGTGPCRPRSISSGTFLNYLRTWET